MSNLYVYFGLAYAVAMAIYWLGVFFILYHLIRFGVSTTPRKLAVVFLGGALVLSLLATILFTQINFGSLKNKEICCDVNPQKLLNTY
jgi:ABC-type multidrug transport system permease subunit